MTPLIGSYAEGYENTTIGVGYREGATKLHSIEGRPLPVMPYAFGFCHLKSCSSATFQANNGP
jgi:hypothetical protein